MENKEKPSKKKTLVRVICGILAFLMISSAAYYTIYFIISAFAK